MTTPHLMTLDALDTGALDALLRRIAELDAAAKDGRLPASLAGRTVANLFYEPSTRTRASFELAARRLGAEVLNLDIDRSSALKGESLLDTIRTLHAMRIEFFIVRHGGHGLLASTAAALAGARLALISAGEGRDGHPTQALIDLATLRERFGGLDGLDIAIVGDLSHSRVAHSVIPPLCALGARVRVAGPRALMPEADAFPQASRHDDLASALDGARAVMALRVQRERIEEAGAPSDADYFADWGLTEERLARHAPEAVVLHPGPFNRGVEIDSEVADGPRSLILRQVALGVPVRMAVLERAAGALGDG